MNSIIGDVTRETLSLMYKEARKTKNQQKIKVIFDIVGNIAMKRIQPYFYAIMAILVLLFLMNCFQFFYYIRAIMRYKIDLGVTDIHREYA
jgi:hypothetical protein